jgi:hypothetical protein
MKALLFLVLPALGVVSCGGNVVEGSSAGTTTGTGAGATTGTGAGTTTGTGAGGTPFACGPNMCQPGDFCSEATVHYPDDIWYNCYPLPPACLQTPTCTCLQDAWTPESAGCEPLGNSCGADPAGHVTVSCDAP